MTESYALFPQIHSSDMEPLLGVSTPPQCQQLQQQEENYSHQLHHHHHQQPQIQPQQEFLYDPMLNCYFQPQRSTSTSFDMVDNTIYPITPMPQHSLFYDTVPMFQPSPYSISQSSIGSPPSFHSECFHSQQQHHQQHQQDVIKPEFTSMMMTPPEEYEIPLFFDTHQVDSMNEDFGDQKNSSLHCITEHHQPPSPQAAVVDTKLSYHASSKRKVCVSRKKNSPHSPPSTKGSPNSSVGSFQCDFPNCSKTFTRTYNLKSHYRTHTDERPFQCPSCPKSFARQHDRNRHEKLHGGIKPYLCEYCEKGFARQDALNRHLKKDKKSRASRKTDSDSAIPPCVLMKIQTHPISKQDSD